MATRCGLILLLLSIGALADTAEERALELNQEMEFLMSVAAKPRVWGKGSLPARDKRSGPAPTQMKGIENLEERYFSDEVSLQAAQAQRDATLEGEEIIDVPDSERVDGTPPKTLRRKR
ncbi:MAG: hypothetical protein ACLGG7_05910 [Bacteriovoracia bacterium]